MRKQMIAALFHKWRYDSRQISVNINERTLTWLDLSHHDQDAIPVFLRL